MILSIIISCEQEVSSVNIKLSSWQYALLLIFFPPVGTFLICYAEEIRPYFKVLALLYCAAVFIILLTLRLPAGRIHIDAVPMD